MEAVDALVPVVAIAAPGALVLLDMAAHDRAPRRAPADPVPEDAPVLAEPVVPVAVREAERERLPEPAGVGAGGGGGGGTLTGEPGDGGEPVYLTLDVASTVDADGSMLSGLRHVEPDERSPVRRVLAFVLLMTLTVLTAAGVAAVIMRAVEALR